MRLVILESPYAATGARTVLDNIVYGRQCLADSLHRGEAPIASHLLYTQAGVLCDDIPEERALGIRAGFAWIQHAELMAVYIDFGMTRGMEDAVTKANVYGIKVEYRLLRPPGILVK